MSFAQPQQPPPQQPVIDLLDTTAETVSQPPPPPPPQPRQEIDLLEMGGEQPSPLSIPAVSNPVYATAVQQSGDIFGNSSVIETHKPIGTYENISVPLVQVLSESDQSIKNKATGLVIKAAFQRVRDRMFLDLLFENKSSSVYSVYL